MNSKQRNKCKRYQGTRLMLAAALTFSAAVPAFSGIGTVQAATAATSQSVVGAQVLGKVNINANSYFELKDVKLHPGQDNNTVLFTVKIYNGGKTDMSFVDYWLRIRTDDGRRISVHTLPEDKSKDRITPKSSIDISFYAEVSEATQLKNLNFDFIKWDFSQPNYERLLGSIAVQDNYTMVTPVGKARTVQMSGVPVNASIQKFYMGKNEKNYTPTIELKLENAGSRSIKLPEYQYLIRTSDGFMYPLEYKGKKDLSILPQTNEKVELTGTVPVSLSPDNWQLVVVQTNSELKLTLPVTSFILPKSAAPELTNTGKEYSFTNEDGSYTAVLNGIQRLPWEDQDILTANITLSNKGDKSLPVPQLTGYFKLDDAVEVEAKLVQTDKVIGIAKGETTTFQLAGKIPYTYSFKEVKLVIEEKAEQGQTADELLEFVHPADQMDLPFLNLGESYQVKNVGRSAEYKVRNRYTYSGMTSDTLSVEIEALNLEKRFNTASRIVAHFKNGDGTVYPAAISEIKNKISPNGRALINLNANLPKGLNTAGMSVVIGEAVTGDKLTEGENKPDAYVNAVAFALPDEIVDAPASLNDIKFGPYTLSLSKLSTRLFSQDSIKLNFDYILDKDMLLEANLEGRSLIVEVEDADDKIKFTKTFDMSKIDTIELKNNTEIEQLRVGEYQNIHIIIEDKDALAHVSTLKDYNLNIYDSVNGQKKLIASQTIRWFSTTE